LLGEHDGFHQKKGTEKKPAPRSDRGPAQDIERERKRTSAGRKNSAELKKKEWIGGGGRQRGGGVNQ